MSRKFQASLKPDKNNWHFTWRPVYIYDHNSPNSSSNKKIYRQNL